MAPICRVRSVMIERVVLYGSHRSTCVQGCLVVSVGLISVDLGDGNDVCVVDDLVW